MGPERRAKFVQLRIRGFLEALDSLTESEIERILSRPGLGALRKWLRTSPRTA
jgi:hypothetical protein